MATGGFDEYHDWQDESPIGPPINGTPWPFGNIRMDGKPKVRQVSDHEWEVQYKLEWIGDAASPEAPPTSE